jgi:hypothetical protein
MLYDHTFISIDLITYLTSTHFHCHALKLLGENPSSWLDIIRKCTQVASRLLSIPTLLLYSPVPKSTNPRPAQNDLHTFTTTARFLENKTKNKSL